RLQPIGQIVGRGQHREYPWQTISFCRLDAPEHRMRMRRANDRRKCLPRKCEVISEGTRSGDQTMVFTTQRRATDTRIGHADVPRAQTALFIVPDEGSIVLPQICEKPPKFLHRRRRLLLAYTLRTCSRPKSPKGRTNNTAMSTR